MSSYRQITKFCHYLWYQLNFMSKLNSDNIFIDFSDYGRPVANFIAEHLKSTKITAIHITMMFGISGILAIYSIFIHSFWAAGVFLIVKSILDAADGQLARAKAKPSFTGRYLDSIFDWVLNFAFLYSIGLQTNTSIGLILIGFFCMQTQGTLYNYYHVILRHSTLGEMTSKIFETKIPIAYPEENQKTVNFLFKCYRLLYYVFDELIYQLDPLAYKTIRFPKWFMSIVSLYGLGFQLLLIAAFLVLGWIGNIIPFIIGYTVLLPLLVLIRRYCFIHNNEI